MQNQLEHFWQVEKISCTDESLCHEDMACKAHFIENVSRNFEGKVVVKLPIRKGNARNLGEIHNITLHRLYSLERRLSQNPQLKLQYTQFMCKYLSLWHMKLMDSETRGRTHFICRIIAR